MLFLPKNDERNTVRLWSRWHYVHFDKKLSLGMNKTDKPTFSMRLPDEHACGHLDSFSVI